MDSAASSQPTTVAGDPVGVDAPVMVDPFLVEALQNPRHRLTILRMELDIQKFLRNVDQQQFEFQHFPTSYLRLAAHRVAQHYGLLTMVQDNYKLDGQGARIVVSKVDGSVYPPICLSDVPIKQSEHNMLELKKIVLKPRPSNSSNGVDELGKRSSIRSVEERIEDYDRARARIFSGSNSPESEDTVSLTNAKDIHFTGINSDGSRDAVLDMERNFTGRDGGTASQVAIFRDREKDRTDPDYDRSYERYVRSHPNGQNFSFIPFHMQKFQPPYLQYDAVLPQLGQMPSTQASLDYYRSPTISPYSGVNLSSRDVVYMPWPSHPMMYAQPYDQFRHTVFQAPVYQQPLSFDYSQNH